MSVGSRRLRNTNQGWTSRPSVVLSAFFPVRAVNGVRLDGIRLVPPYGPGRAEAEFRVAAGGAAPEKQEVSSWLVWKVPGTRPSPWPRVERRILPLQTRLALRGRLWQLEVLWVLNLVSRLPIQVSLMFMRNRLLGNSEIRFGLEHTA